MYVIAAVLPHIHPCTVGGNRTGKFVGYALFSEAPTDQQHAVKQSPYSPMYLACSKYYSRCMKSITYIIAAVLHT